MKKIQDLKICITGAGGFIGRRLMEILRERGATVSGLEINPESASLLSRENFQIFTGSTSDPEILKKFLMGNDIVIHTAAIVNEDGSFDEFREVNVRSTILIANLAKELGLRGMVHLSSVMVYGFDYIENVDENGELKGEGNPYCTTKIEGERALKEIMTAEFGIIFIRPGDVYGPGSKPWVVRPLQLMKMGLFSLPDGGMGIMNCTYIDNLCEGILLTIVNEAYGETFNITDGECITWKEYFYGLADAGGYRKPIRLPLSLAILLLEVVSFMIKLGGRPSPVSREGIKFVLRKNSVSIHKAKNILNYKPVISMKEGLSITYDWVRKNFIG